MSLIVNPGSGAVPSTGEGWTNTAGVTVYLETHGVDDLDAYMKGRFFPPRVYWNGSSSATPKLENWAAPGFVQVQTFRAEEGT